MWGFIRHTSGTTLKKEIVVVSRGCGIFQSGNAGMEKATITWCLAVFARD